MRWIAAALALSLIGCAEARAKRALAEREKPHADKSIDGLGDYTCELLTMTGTHVPKTYCFYDDEDAASVQRVKMQTHLITSEATCPPDAPSCPRGSNGP
jgi:hypothetical protein